MKNNKARKRARWPEARRRHYEESIVFALPSVPIREDRTCKTADQLFDTLNLRGYKQDAKQVLAGDDRRSTKCFGPSGVHPVQPATRPPCQRSLDVINAEHRGRLAADFS